MTSGPNATDHMREFITGANGDDGGGCWRVPDTHRGLRIDGLPVPHPDLPANTVIKSMMVLGVDSKDKEMDASTNKVLGNDDRCKMLEIAEDYFYGMIHTYYTYLKTCRRVRSQTGLKDGDSNLTAMLSNGVISDPSVQSDIENLFQNMHSNERSKDKSAVPEDLSEYTTGMREKIRDSQHMLQVVNEVLPREGKTQRSCHRVRCYALIIAAEHCEHVKSWTDVLRMMYENNMKTMRVMSGIRMKSIRSGKTGPEPKRQKVNDKSDTHRALHTTYYTRAMLDWVDVLKAHINQKDSTPLNYLGGLEFYNSLCTYPDDVDHSIGPWDPTINSDDPRSALKVDEVFSMHVELSKQTSKHTASLSQKFPQQSDSMLYFRKLFCPHNEAELPPAEQRQSIISNLDQSGKPEYEVGVSFEHLPLEVRETCIFQIPLENFSQRDSHITKPCFASWWEKQDVYTHTCNLTAGNAMRPCMAGFPNPFIGGEVLDGPMQVAQATTFAQKNTKNTAKNQYDFTHNPLTQAKAVNTQNEERRRESIEQLRAGEDVPWTPASQLQQSAAETLLVQIANNDETCDSTAAVCKWIKSGDTKSHSYFMGKRKDVWRFVHSTSLDPGMEPSMLGMALRLFYYETELDIAVNHLILAKLHESVIDTMQPHKGLFKNQCLFGKGMTGKNKLTEEIQKKAAIPGTFLITGYTSELAALGEGKAQYHQFVVFDEALDNFVAEPGKKGAKGRGEAGNKGLSVEKRKLTENILDSSTLAHDETGKKTTIKIAIPWHCGSCYISNLGSLNALPEAFRTRLEMDMVPLVNRVKRSAADKNACSDKSGVFTDESIEGDVTLSFKQWQAYAFMYGNNEELACGESTNMSVFTYVWELFSEAMRKMQRFVMDPRAITRAKISARVATLEGRWYSDNLMPHGFFTNRDITLSTFFDNKHRYEMGNICSFGTAVRCIKTSLAGSIGNGITSQICRTVVWMLHNKDTEQFSDLFCSSPPEPKFQSRQQSDEPVDPSKHLDLNYVCMVVPQGDTGLEVLADLISQNMKHAVNSSLTSDQCFDALTEMLNFGSVNHHQLDVRFPVERIYGECLESWQEGIEYSLLEWIRYCKEEGPDIFFKAGDLNDIQRLWKADTDATKEDLFDSEYWPRENAAREIVTNRILKLDPRLGRVMISTNFLAMACKSKYMDEFDVTLDKMLATVCTTEQIIAIPENSMLDINPSVPYLPKTQRIKHGSVNRSVTNQRYVAKKHRGGNLRRGKLGGRQKKEKWYVANVPISVQVLVEQFEICCERYATPMPSAHYLLDLDPQGISAIFAPHVLDLLLTESDQFKEEYTNREDGNCHFDTMKDIATEFISTKYPDLIRHYEADGTPAETGEDADFTATEFAKKVAHVVTEMSLANRMGSLRENMLNTEEIEEALDEMHCVETILEFVEQQQQQHGSNWTLSEYNVEEETELWDMVTQKRPDSEYDMFTDVYNRLQLCSTKEIKEHADVIEQNNKETFELHEAAIENSGTDRRFTSFIDEWRSLKKTGAHNGPGYIAYIRKEGKRMMAVRAKRDSWLYK